MAHDTGHVSRGRATKSSDGTPNDMSAASKEELTDAETSTGQSSEEDGSTPLPPDKGTAPRTGVVGRVMSFNWTPQRCRYDAANPPKFTLSLNIIFALAGSFTVANLYYMQPILNKIAHDFNVSYERSSSIATLTQAGYAAGLLLICPLGDIFRRRWLILSLMVVTAALWLGLCLTNNFAAFSALSLLTGMTTVTPQLLLPLVGDLTPPHRRAGALAVTSAGLMLGILIARLLSGIVANYTAWRNIYWVALGAQAVVTALLYAFMPDYPSKNPGGIGYVRVMASIVRLLFTEPLLVQASAVAFALSAAFTSFWTTLTFLLASPPYEYSPLAIGLFALIGVAVICTAPVYGRLVIDRFVPLYSAIGGIVIELVGIVVGTFVGDFSVAGPVIQAILMDLGQLATQVANRSAIYGIDPRAGNRVNTAFMVAAFCGQLTGTAVGNRLYALGGWRWSSGCNIGFAGFALLVCFVRGPREKGWVGWHGGWSPYRDDVPPKKTPRGDVEAAETHGEGSEAVEGQEKQPNIQR